MKFCDRGTLLVLITLSSLLSACATMTAPNYFPKYEVIDSIRVKNRAFEKVGVDEAQPTDPKAKVNKVTLRGVNLVSPYGTYPKYIETALKADLAEFKILDQNSPNRINVEVTKNDINILGVDKGQGILEVKLKVLKKGKLALEKVYLAETSFESYFSGAEAIPAGQSQYAQLVQALTVKIFSDEEFQAAIERDKK